MACYQHSMADDTLDADRHSVSFHEATVVSFCRKGSNIELQLEGVTTDQGIRAAKVVLEAVAGLVVDGRPQSALTMEAQDAEVFSLKLNEIGMVLILEWNDWEPRRQFVRTYDVRATAVSVVIIPKD